MRWTCVTLIGVWGAAAGCLGGCAGGPRGGGGGGPGGGGAGTEATAWAGDAAAVTAAGPPRYFLLGELDVDGDGRADAGRDATFAALAGRRGGVAVETLTAGDLAAGPGGPVVVRGLSPAYPNRAGGADATYYERLRRYRTHRELIGRLPASGLRTVPLREFLARPVRRGE